MTSFLDPTELAVLKKLEIESKLGNSGKRYKLKEFWRLRFGGNLKLLNYLKSLEDGGFCQVSKFNLDIRYLKFQEAVNRIKLITHKLSNDSYFGLGRKYYLMTKKGIEFKWDDVCELNRRFEMMKNQDFDEYLTFGIDFPDKGKKIATNLRVYIKSFILGELIGPGATRYYSYDWQKRSLLRTIGRLAKFYGIKNWVLNMSEVWMEDLAQSKTLYEYNQSQMRFLDTVLALEYEGLIKIGEVVNEDMVRISILPAKLVPSSDDWTRDFYDLTSKISFDDFITRKIRQSKRGVEQQADVLKWGELSLANKSGWGEYRGVRHRFRPKLPAYKVLRRLLEAQGTPVTYPQFFSALGSMEFDNEKDKKEFVRQKVRDIRKAFKINRHKDPQSDIFYDTGDGFQLMESV